MAMETRAKPVIPHPPKKRPQEVARHKHAYAQRMVTQKAAALKRLVTALRRWERKAAYYATRMTMTDAQLEAERQQRKAQSAKAVRRGMVVPKGEQPA